jgi:hypothetical protein
MDLILEKLLKEYPFNNNSNQSFYLSGYVDKK